MARQHVVRGSGRVLVLGRRGRTAAARLRADQAVPDVPRANREGRGMRANDVQTMQTRVLLVLPGFPGRKFIVIIII